MNPHPQMKPASRAARVLLFFLILIACGSGATSGSAQAVGDPIAKVKRHRGLPAAMRDDAGRQVWIYADGTRVEFEGGLVTAVSDAGAAADRAAFDEVEVEESTGASTVTIYAPPPTVEQTQRSTSRIREQSDHKSRLAELAGSWKIVVVAILAVVSLGCQIVLLVRAFRESMFWGLGCLLIPLVMLFFVISHWYESRGPFLLNLACAVAMVPLMMLPGA